MQTQQAVFSNICGLTCACSKIQMTSLCRLQVVLLHGQAFTSKTWEELGTMALLAINGYQALAMDLPGRT